jgi:hypothetical protein
MVDIITFGLYRSTVSTETTIWDIPYQSAVRSMVPRFHGSDMPSSTSTISVLPFGRIYCVFPRIRTTSMPQSLDTRVVIRASSLLLTTVYSQGIRTPVSIYFWGKNHSDISISDFRHSSIHFAHSTRKYLLVCRADFSWRLRTDRIWDLEIILYMVQST